VGHGIDATFAQPLKTEWEVQAWQIGIRATSAWFNIKKYCAKTPIAVPSSRSA
jgi:hypothetical protein